MSPARTSERGTSGSWDAIASAVLGTRTPTDPQARATSPEQSKHFGPLPPQQYRFPTCAEANLTTASARAVVGCSRPAHARETRKRVDRSRGGAAEQPMSAMAKTESQRVRM